MATSDDVKHVCIHGHFYQPPRENPWLEEIEREESAHPFHDWNERIAEECYKPNAAARILDGDGRIHDLKNNYEHLSFNFGPTLLRWMERHSPTAYQSILDADRASFERTHGHGNAIAQVYNHVILPLANARDKQTQIRWGIRDFEMRFGRKPEGMWLAETAVDKDTLAALADNDISFTILSPYQAARWRTLDGSPWRVTDGNGAIPTGRAYVYQGHDGRPIHLFFYDGAIAKGIAFERMLGDSSHLVGAIDHAHRTRNGALPGEPWLVHTATDGESYGHHFAHGDMALAAAFARLEKDPKARIVNYATFLAQNPVRAEADVLEVSAWSCAHGVGRWSRDCGCHIGGEAGWTQKWREPLRDALDGLRDALAVHYERAMDDLVRDPWEVRDAYIDVVLDPSRARAFAHEHVRRGVELAGAGGHERLVRFFSLLEMQRAALLMYTSCGWFFDDVSGGESIILLKYAARALELARATGATDGEGVFLQRLARAESNIPGPRGEKVTGRELFFERARSVAVTTDKVVVSHALRALSEGTRRSSTLYAYRVTYHEEVPLKKGAVPCLVGSVTVEDGRTFETENRLYALAHFGGLDFRCSTRPLKDAGAAAADTHAVVESIRAAAVQGSTAAMMRALDDAFGARAYTLKDAFYDLRQAAARTIGAEKVTVLNVVGAELLENHRALLLALRELGVPLPAHVETLASHVLSDGADLLVRELIEASRLDADPAASADIDFAWRATASRLRAIAEEAAALGLRLDVASAGRALGDAIVDALREFAATRDEDRATAALRLVDACSQLGIGARMWEVQTAHYRLIQASRRDEPLRAALRTRRDLVDALDRFGKSTFSRFLDDDAGV